MNKYFKCLLGFHIIDENSIKILKYYINNKSICPIKCEAIGLCLECNREVRLTPHCNKAN